MISISWADIEGLRRFDNILKSLGDDFPKVAARAINRTGDMARTQVVRTLARQTGLKQATIRRAVKINRASWGDLRYEMKTRGGDISLKYFKARETRRGVTAAPFGQRKLFAGTFIKGGRFPRRVALSMGGHVWQRIGAGRMPLAKFKSGVIIPAEMVKGATASAFDASVRANLPRRVEHEINRLLR